MLLYEFSNLSEIRLETPLSIKDLSILALNNKESGWCEQDGPIDELADNVQDALMQKSDMLKEYFGLCISSSGYLESLPLILGQLLMDFIVDRIFCNKMAKKKACADLDYIFKLVIKYVFYIPYR